MQQTNLIAIIMFTLTLSLIGCDEQEGPCMVPLGTYTMEVSAASGNCNTETVIAITSLRQDIEIDEESECGSIRSSVTQPLEGTDCMMTVLITADGSIDGIENGEMTLTITECEDMNCEHVFNLYLEGR